MKKETGRPSVGLAVFGGFILGAAAVLVIVWLFGAAEEPGTASRPAPDRSPPHLEGTLGDDEITARPGDLEATGPHPPSMPPPADLRRRDLRVPVRGITTEELADTFDDARGGGRVHEAIDIMAPTGTPVVAVEDGRIAKLFESQQGGLTIYQFDPSEKYTYYYAHLDRYAPGLQENGRVRRGQVLGYVGSTGNADADSPHLHFAIFELGPEKNWWQGTPVNPFPVLREAEEGDARAAR